MAMITPAVLYPAATAGFVAADVTTPNYGSLTGIGIGAAAVVLVAVIGAGTQLWTNRRRNSSDDPRATVETRLTVLENNQADMTRQIERNQADLKGRIDEILAHVRPWPADERGRR